MKLLSGVLKLVSLQVVDVSGEAQKGEAQEVSETEFPIVKVIRDEAGSAVRMETPVLVMEGENLKDSPKVVLYGAIHLGDESYYQELNFRFAKPEVVLYELVAPEGVIPDGHNRSLLTRAQGLMAKAMGLSHQIDCIDYSSKKFVHADLSPTELKKKMSERGDTFFSIALAAASEVLRQSARTKGEVFSKDAISSADMISLLQEKEGVSKFKRELVEQIASSDVNLGSVLNQYVIEDRNKRCVEELQRQLRAGKKDVAIFYGSAHLSDLVERIGDLGFSVTGSEWLSAIDLQKAVPEKSPAEIFSESFQDEMIKEGLCNPVVQTAVKRVLKDPHFQEIFGEILADLAK